MSTTEETQQMIKIISLEKAITLEKQKLARMLSGDSLEPFLDRTTAIRAKPLKDKYKKGASELICQLLKTNSVDTKTITAVCMKAGYRSKSVKNSLTYLRIKGTIKGIKKPADKRTCIWSLVA